MSIFKGVDVLGVDDMPNDYLRVLLHGPQGCIAPWTRIYDADTQTHREVWTLDELVVDTIDGPHRTDGPPFIKGEDHLWTVCTADGSEVTVTGAHRFLTPTGWQRLDHVRVGQQLAAAPHAPRQGASSCRCELPVGAHRSRGTAADSRRGYLTCRRCGGPRPLSTAAADRSSVPSPNGGGGRIPDGSPHDGPASSRAGSRACPPSSRHARSGCAPFEPEGSDEGYPDGAWLDVQRVPSDRSVRRSHQTSIPEPTADAADRRRSRSGLAVMQRSSVPELSPFPYGTRMTEITSITYAGYGVFYDLSVPGPEHYFAEGLVHHNSGKTTLASTVAEVGKTLFIDLTGEKGVRSFRGAPYAKNIEVIRPKSVTVMDDVFWTLNKGGHGYKAVVIDSLTAVQKMTMRYLLGHDETAVKEIRQGTAPAQIQTWGQSLDVMVDTATFWFGLADGNRPDPMHVIMTAQTKISENEETGSIQRVPDVQKGALSIVLATPDYVMYTDTEENLDAEDEDDPPVHHIVRFGNNPDYRIKARVPYNLRGRMPSVIGRKSAPNLPSLGRVLGVGGVPAKKKATPEKKENAA